MGKIIGVAKLYSQILKNPVLITKSYPENIIINKCLKLEFYLVVPNRFWKLKDIEAIRIMYDEGDEILNISFERLLYDKRLYLITLIVKFKNPGTKSIGIILNFGKRGSIKCKIIKIRVKNL